MRKCRRRLICTGAFMFLTTLIFIGSFRQDVRLKFQPDSVKDEIILYFQKRFNIFVEVKYDKASVRTAIHARTQSNLDRQVWPANNTDNDRIIAQLNFKHGQEQKTPALKTILVWSGLKHWRLLSGQSEFLSQNCPVNACVLSENKSESENIDLVLLQSTGRPWRPRKPDQIWMMFNIEAPPVSPDWSGVNGLINWTATYRHDSTIVAPYAKFVPYSTVEDFEVFDRNYAREKTKKVAWFVSNCFTSNEREMYVKELGRYIDIDIYGGCGTFKCPRGPGCLSRLNDQYKFYLAFENANCREYITEKFFFNGLQ